MPHKKKRILVTGAEGFIGSHLVEALLNEGYDINALVYYNSFGSSGWLETIPHVKEAIKIYLGDIRDSECVLRAMQHCDLVIHLAALIGIPYSYHAPHSYVDTNIKGTLNIVSAARQLNVEKMIHTSTSEVYGSAQFIPMTEQHPLEGQSPYAASKIGADQIALSFFKSFQTPVTILRPFNVYGPRQSTRAIIPTIIMQILKGEKKIKIGSLKPTRDLNFVSDTVAAFVAAVKSETIIGEILNIGNQHEFSMQQVLMLIMKLMNVNLPIEEDSIRVRPLKSEVERLLADNQKAQRLLAWLPKFLGVNGLEAGLKKTIAWFTENQNSPYYAHDNYHI